jgi:hypothetical protein
MRIENVTVRFEKLNMKEQSCSRALIDLCIEDMGREKEGMADAMTDFCNGMGRGEICGLLAAAIAAIHVTDLDKERETVQDNFMDWFLNRFGGYDCEELVYGNETLKRTYCPRIALETCLELKKYIRHGG